MNFNKINIMKKIIITLCIICLFAQYVTAAIFSYEEDIDYSVDEQIKNEYKTKQAEEDLLPPLPETYNDDEKYIQQEKVTVPNIQKTVTLNNVITHKIPAGKKFKVKILNNLSGNTKKNSVISFETIYPTEFAWGTIPMKTRFRGKVMNAHNPQLSGNGALLVLSVTEINYNGQSFPAQGKVIFADNKNIFFNNIKGERQYISNMAKTIKPTSRFYDKMWRSTRRLSRNMPEAILSPFPFLVGGCAYLGGVAVSPMASLFKKGSQLNIRAGEYAIIKITDDVFVY